MQRDGNSTSRAALAFGAIFFFIFAAQAKAVTRPSLAAPADDATVQALPVLKWGPVAGAAKYEVQVSSDSGFDSVVSGGDFFTRNTHATLRRSLPNGRLYWRVRTSNASGAVSAWSSTRSVMKSWSEAPTAISPAGGATLTYPMNPLMLKWSGVPRTFKYSVTIASDPSLATPLAGFPILTTATSLSYQPPDLKPDTYYWSVTPQDSRGNKGAPSDVSSFVWNWPTLMSPVVADLVDADELYDPRFSWSLVPGAASYEVEVNSDNEFDTGSVVLDRTTLGSTLAPRQLLPNNTYYWRVRAIDPDDNKGVWNEGDPFQKSFADETVLGHSSVQNLHMFYPDADGITAGYQTTTPLVMWDPVPGASSYQVEVGEWTGAICNYNSPLTSITATTAWSPLGSSPSGDPYSTPAFTHPTSDSLFALSPTHQYCVRVRPHDRSDSLTQDGNQIVVGTFTELNPLGYSFDWTGYPSGGACSPSCFPGYLGASDYLAPVAGTTTGTMPVFRWNPVSGAQSYFVVVARDAAFTTVVDYAFTQAPVYAPRRAASDSRSRTYSDETTKFYWVVLPSPNLNGNPAVSNPLNGAASNFLKQTTPPDLLSPAEAANVATWPTFRWTPVNGTRVYEIQVADAPTFSSPLDDKITNSTAYTSETTYPADTILYWRVRPLDDERTSLTWSDVRTFKRKLPTAAWDLGLPTSGATTPTLTWAPITGAVSYDLDTDKPDGTHKLWSDLRSAALTYSTFYGTGVFGQRVRANFPSSSGGPTHGPWSTTLNFTRTIPAPDDPATSVGSAGVSFSWSPRPEAREYRVQISKTTDFASPIETTVTDNTSYAPPMTTPGYQAGGKFYWRVAAVDEGRNVGHYTAAHGLTLAKGMRLSVFGTPRKGKRVTLRVSVHRLGVSSPVAQAAVRLVGSGVSTSTKRTHADGTVLFHVRATKRGTVWAIARKRGFQEARLALRVS